MSSETAWHPCRRRPVRCEIVAGSGAVLVIAYNRCRSTMPGCAREPHGKHGDEGYELCDPSQHTEQHAEARAVEALGKRLGSDYQAWLKAVVTGNYYICWPCAVLLRTAGVREYVIRADPPPPEAE